MSLGIKKPQADLASQAGNDDVEASGWEVRVYRRERSLRWQFYCGDFPPSLALCCLLCCEHCVSSKWFKHGVGDTVLAEFCGNTVSDTAFCDAVGTKKHTAQRGHTLTFSVKASRPVATNSEAANLARYTRIFALGGTCRCTQTLKLTVSKSC